MDITTMTKAMIMSLPDPAKVRTRERFYIKTGFVDEDGKSYMAHKDCNVCGGRGYSCVAKPKMAGKVKTIPVRCRCMVTVELPVDFVILPRERR